MSQNFQESEEIERRVSEIAIEKLEENKPVTAELQLESVEILETRIRRYTIIVYAVAFITGILNFAQLPNFYYFKDDLKEKPGVYVEAVSFASYPWTIKPLFGYLQDSFYLFGYRSKAWFVLSCSLGAFISFQLYLSKPSVSMFTFYYLLLNIGVVISDVMASGLSLVIVNLKKAHAEAIGEREKRRNSEIAAFVDSGTKKGKKVYGNYILLRFMVRNIGKFVGGVLAKSISLNSVYAVVGLVQVSVLALLLVIPETREVKWFNPEVGNILTLLKQTFKALWRKELMLPFSLVLLSRICPDVSESGNYITTDEMKWTPLQLSFNILASSLLYFAMMLYIINWSENMSFRTKMYIAALSGLSANYIFYRFVMYEDLGFYVMYALNILATIFSNLNFEFFMIAFVGKLSTFCPKGMEGFVVAVVMSVMNFFGIQGNMIGAKLMNHYKIEKGSYDNQIYPMAIAFFYSAFVLLLAPILAKE